MRQYNTKMSYYELILINASIYFGIVAGVSQRYLLHLLRRQRHRQTDLTVRLQRRNPLRSPRLLETIRDRGKILPKQTDRLW